MNLRQLKVKIKSIGSIGQITKAMQLVSAVKMKKSQDKALQARPYRIALQETINSLVQNKNSVESSLTISNKNIKKKLAIVISSNKGLCGIFNFNLFRFLLTQIKDFSEYDFVVMGTKAQQFLFHYGGNIILDFSNKTPFENNVTAIFDFIRQNFIDKKYQNVDLFYNQFVSSMVFKSTKEVLLPLNLDSLPKLNTEVQRSANHLVEPEANTVISGLFNFYLENEIRMAIRDSEASEHSARMIAMKNATDNSQDLVYRLTLLRNGIRQEKITNELLDMNTAKLAVSA